MAYNNYFPATYQPAYYPQNAYQTQFQTPQAPQMTQQAQQGQQAGFIRVQSENEARMYPVAPGNSVTFINENAPYCYTKSVDMSQLDRPKFEKYRLVKEDDTPNLEPTPIIEYAPKSDLVPIWDEINALKEKITKKVQAKKKEDEDE